MPLELPNLSHLDSTDTWLHLGSRSIVEFLSNISGPKKLIFGPYVAKLYHHLVVIPTLKALNCELAFLSRRLPDNVPESIVFFVYPDDDVIRDICSAIKSIQGLQRSYYFIFIGRFTGFQKEMMRSHTCEPDASHVLSVFDLPFIPLSSKLFVSPCPKSFMHIYCNGDQTKLWELGYSLTKYQADHGQTFSSVYTLGAHAERLFDCMQFDSLSAANSDAGQLLIVDRAVDYANALKTQFSYGGCLAEYLGYNNLIMRVEKDVIPNQAMRDRLYAFNDLVFGDIWKLRFENVRKILKDKLNVWQAKMEETTQSLQEAQDYKSRTDVMRSFTHQQDLSRTYLDKIGEHVALEQHVFNEYIANETFNELINFELNLLDNYCEFEHIYDFMSTKTDPQVILRLVAMYCVILGGFDSVKMFNNFRKIFVRTYGYHHAFTLNNLQQAGLLFVRDKKQKPFMDELLPDLCTQIHNGSTLRLPKKLNLNVNNHRLRESTERRLTVFFLGGCTYDEYIALDSLNIDLTIITTKLISTNTLIKEVFNQRNDVLPEKISAINM
ncbi:hypothetical protein PCE1_000607 [Barthelona sp. PCE]